MTIEEFKLKQKELNIEHKKVDDQKTNMLKEQFPYEGKCIEIIIQDTLCYMKCNKVSFDGYYRFDGIALLVRGQEFTFNAKGYVGIPEDKVEYYQIREVNEDEFNKCIQEGILEIVKQALDSQENNNENPEPLPDKE